MRSFFVVILILSIALLAQSIKRTDFALEYKGFMNLQHFNLTLKAETEDIETTIHGDGNINYKVKSRIGPVSHMSVQLAPSGAVNTNFTGMMSVSFGPSHIHQPHSFVARNLGFVTVIPSDHEILALSGHFNITKGVGAFMDAHGAVNVIGYTTVATKESIWLVTSIFWTPK